MAKPMNIGASGRVRPPSAKTSPDQGQRAPDSSSRNVIQIPRIMSQAKNPVSSPNTEWPMSTGDVAKSHGAIGGKVDSGSTRLEIR